MRVLVDQGRKQTWLAERVGCGKHHLNRVLRGRVPATAAFRASCAAALGLSEAVLFHDDDSSGPHGGRLDRAGTAAG